MIVRRILCACIAVCFVSSLIVPPQRAYAQGILNLPEPGTMVSLSSAYTPVLIKGLKINPTNPLALDFIVATGNSQLTAQDPRLKKESEKLIKYFFAALTLPEKDVWVNLSPYEKDRIVPKATGETEMGRDMLAEDYILKQITASLIYPDKGLGKEFWSRVYSEASRRFGVTQIPVNTFNKVWIVADKASVYEAKDTVMVIDSHLKVMLEEDYLATTKHQISTQSTIGSQVVRQIVLPALEKEVNEGKNFANLRQIFHSLILAKWYKESLKTALLNQVYSNQNKVGGLAFQKTAFADPQYIYQQYLKAYKKGVFNYIKEEIDQTTRQSMPKKYFSGGVATLKGLNLKRVGSNEAMLSLKSLAAGALLLIGVAATTSTASAGGEQSVNNVPQMSAISSNSISDFKKLKEGWRLETSGEKAVIVTGLIGIGLIPFLVAINRIEKKYLTSRVVETPEELKVEVFPMADPAKNFSEFMVGVFNKISSIKKYYPEGRAGVKIRNNYYTIKVSEPNSLEGESWNVLNIFFNKASRVFTVEKVLGGSIGGHNSFETTFRSTFSQEGIVNETVSKSGTTERSEEIIPKGKLTKFPIAAIKLLSNGQLDSLVLTKEAFDALPEDNRKEGKVGDFNVESFDAAMIHKGLVGRSVERLLAVVDRSHEAAVRVSDAFKRKKVQIGGIIFKNPKEKQGRTDAAMASKLLGTTPESGITPLELVERIQKDESIPLIVTISDEHGTIDKMDLLLIDALRKVPAGQKIPEDFVLDPNRAIADQLFERFGIKLADFKGQIFFHNLGDFMDRGPYGVKVFYRSKELVDAKLSDFVIGNHDQWMFMNLAGLHLPYYDHFEFYGYKDSYDAKKRRRQCPVFTGAETSPKSGNKRP